MAKIFINANGTYDTSFQIGGYAGATIYQGSGTPSNELGVNGDVYLCTTATAIYLKSGSTWITTGESGSSGIFYATQLVMTSATIGASTSYTKYLTTLVHAPYATPTLTFPDSPSSGLFVYVKDISGAASINFPIAVTDGTNYWYIDIPHGVIQFLYTGTQWVVISELTSYAPNQMELYGGGAPAIALTSYPGTISSAVPFTVEGTVEPTNTAVQVGVSPNDIFAPSNYISATVTDTTWTATIVSTFGSSGNAYIWASQTENPGIYTYAEIAENAVEATIGFSPFDYTEVPNTLATFTGYMTPVDSAVQFGITSGTNTLPDTWIDATVSGGSFSVTAVVPDMTFDSNLIPGAYVNYYVCARLTNDTGVISYSNLTIGYPVKFLTFDGSEYSAVNNIVLENYTLPSDFTVSWAVQMIGGGGCGNTQNNYNFGSSGYNSGWYNYSGGNGGDSACSTCADNFYTLAANQTFYYQVGLCDSWLNPTSNSAPTNTSEGTVAIQGNSPNTSIGSLTNSGQSGGYADMSSQDGVGSGGGGGAPGWFPYSMNQYELGMNPNQSGSGAGGNQGNNESGGGGGGGAGDNGAFSGGGSTDDNNGNGGQGGPGSQAGGGDDGGYPGGYQPSGNNDGAGGGGGSIQGASSYGQINGGSGGNCEESSYLNGIGPSTDFTHCFVGGGGGGGAFDAANNSYGQGGSGGGYGGGGGGGPGGGGSGGGGVIVIFYSYIPS